MIILVAEKRSVANLVAKALGGKTFSRDGYLALRADNDYLIMYPNGHGIRMMYPDEISEEYVKWTLSQLPINPQSKGFPHRPSHKQGKLCVDLLKRHYEDAEEVINACDAGREGELIFAELIEYAGFDPYSEKTSRVWIGDTTTEGIRKAIDERTPANHDKFVNLGHSARLRKYADYIYGINGTRYYEISRRGAQREGKSSVIGIGRVKTPVLQAVNLNNQKVDRWKPTPYYQGYVTFASDEGGEYEALVLAPEQMQFGATDVSFRDDAELIRYLRKAETTAGLEWSVQDKSEAKEEYSYPPFNLNDLLRSAFRLFNWESSYTNRLLDNLEKKDQAISYPRTESNHLPEEMDEEVNQILLWLERDYLLQEFPESKDLELDWAFNWFDSKKCKDHHAITPLRIPDVIDRNGEFRDEYRLWELIARRFMLASLPPAKVLAFSRLSIATHFDKTSFRTMLRSAPVVHPGYLELHEIVGGTEYKGEQTLSVRRKRNVLPDPVSEAVFRTYRISRKKTQQPDKFNDDTLLSYMEINKLGTAATRAGIIEELREKKAIAFDHKKGYDITPAGKGLVAHIEDRGVKEMLNVELTMAWEEQLQKIEEGKRTKLSDEIFLSGILAKIEEMGMRLNTDEFVEEVVICPKSGKIVDFAPNGYVFQGWPKMEFPYDFKGRRMNGTEWKEVIQSGASGGGPFKFFSPKTNKNFEAYLVFKKRDNRIEFKFRSRKKRGMTSI